ncbi:MAG: hypothetical protein HY675_04640 [Chloroflexi bacterium]|nr:hypothetical protein [Chloroflexota bacterium]
MSQDSYPINIWINEERYEKLQQAGVAQMAEEVLAGLKAIQVPATSEQKDALLEKFPMAKCDTATTGTIELLPRDVKDRIFDLVVEKRSVDVVGDFLKVCD